MVFRNKEGRHHSCIALCVTLSLACGVWGQYKAPSVLFNELYADKQAELKELLERHPDLYPMYYPMQHSIPKDYYM